MPKGEAGILIKSKKCAETSSTIDVILKRAPALVGGKLESYGFKSRQSANGAKYITDVFTPGLSYGKLKTNDVILCIDGRDATIIAHKEFTSILASSLRVTLTVERFHDMSAFQHRTASTLEPVRFG